MIETPLTSRAGQEVRTAAPAVARTAEPPVRRHVLMVAPTSFFADYGCHVRILEETRVLQRLGQTVTVATYHNGRDLPGIDVRRTLPIPWRRDYEVGSSRHKLAFDALLTVTTLRAALRCRPDVIHGHLHEGALIGALVARLLRRPLVFDLQGSLSAEMVDHGFLAPEGRMHDLVRVMERLINRLPSAIVTSSGHARRYLERDWGVDRSRLVTLPDCVDAKTFRPGVLDDDARQAALEQLGVPPGRRVVVYLGLLAEHQGTDLLLEAARAVVDRRPQTHFLIMGFPGTEVYRARAAALGLAGHTTFTGRVPYEQAPAHLSLGDVAVAPKISTTEGSGKLLNYMAMGLPTVAFDTPVSREYLAEHGCYARRGDAAALAEQLRALLDDPTRGRAIGGRLRARAAAGYDWARAGRQLLALYDRLASAATAMEREA